jgi:hypothetical protein
MIESSLQSAEVLECHHQRTVAKNLRSSWTRLVSGSSSRIDPVRTTTTAKSPPVPWNEERAQMKLKKLKNNHEEATDSPPAKSFPKCSSRKGTLDVRPMLSSTGSSTACNNCKPLKSRRVCRDFFPSGCYGAVASSGGTPESLTLEIPHQILSPRAR